VGGTWSKCPTFLESFNKPRSTNTSHTCSVERDAMKLTPILEKSSRSVVWAEGLSLYTKSNGLAEFEAENLN
jgi:hypothetical protein